MQDFLEIQGTDVSRRSAYAPNTYVPNTYVQSRTFALEMSRAESPRDIAVGTSKTYGLSHGS